MAYLLATTETQVRWYMVDMEKKAELTAGDYELTDVLDLSRVSGFGNKETAKKVAIAIGLKTWKYVQMNSVQRSYSF